MLTLLRELVHFNIKLVLTAWLTYLFGQELNREATTISIVETLVCSANINALLFNIMY